MNDEAVRLRLLCFPYAGGSAWSFCSWLSGLTTGVEVCGIELPGRATPPERNIRGFLGIQNRE